MPVITEVEDRLVELGAPGLAAMVDALASDDVVRIHIAGRLRAEDDPRATPFLLDALTDHEGAVRAAAVEALSSSSDPVVVDALDRALHDQSPAVRAAAAFALGQHGDVRAVDALIEVGRSDPHRIAAVAAYWVHFAEAPTATRDKVGEFAPVPGLVDVLRPVLAAVPAVVEKLRTWNMGGDRVLEVVGVPRSTPLASAAGEAGGHEPPGRALDEDFTRHLGLVANQEAIVSELVPVPEPDAQAVFATLGIAHPNHYSNAMQAFSGLRQYLAASPQVPVETFRLSLGDASKGNNFAFVGVADETLPMGLLVCVLAGGGLMGHYSSGTEWRSALHLEDAE